MASNTDIAAVEKSVPIKRHPEPWLERAKAKQRAGFIPLLVYSVIIGRQLSERIPGAENTEVNTMYNNPCFHRVRGQYEGLTMKKNAMCCHVKNNTAGKPIQSRGRGRAYWGQGSLGQGGQGRRVTFDKRHK